MPEMRFDVRWPDGRLESCYSPSLVVKEHVSAGEAYELDEFVSRIRTALTIASARVQAKYGFPCSRAIGQLARIEDTARAFRAAPDARVTVEAFAE